MDSREISVEPSHIELVKVSLPLVKGPKSRAIQLVKILLDVSSLSLDEVHYSVEPPE